MGVSQQKHCCWNPGLINITSIKAQITRADTEMMLKLKIKQENLVDKKENHAGRLHAKNLSHGKAAISFFSLPCPKPHQRH